MATKDLASVKRLITVTSGSTIIDTCDFEALTYLLQVQDTTAVTLEHGDESDLSDATTVDADFIIGETSFTATGNAIIGYVGKKRYVRVTVANAVASTSIFAVPEKLRVIGQLEDVDKTERT